MFEKRFYYLVKFQFLGYRYHGWQKQPDVKTLHSVIDRTLKYILEGRKFKTLSAGRTDAKVSAVKSVFELFLIDKPLQNFESFIKEFNNNLPQDIRILSIEQIDSNFNVIKDSKFKEYHYIFSEGEKCHPFCSPILTTILDHLDIEMMIKGANLFKGVHNFKSYCYKPSNTGVYTREIKECELIENNIYKANFFPKRSYLLKVVGKGFGRHQIRLMMGALIQLGKSEISLNYIKDSLKIESDIKIDYIAPANGLILNNIEFN